MKASQWIDLASQQPPVSWRLEAWHQARFGRRLWARDPTLWSARPVGELANRLGWLDLPGVPDAELDAMARFGETVAREGVEHIVLLGMGGSSLAPEVFQATFGNAAGRPALVVLDSTHPSAVASIARRVEPGRTLFVVSSKSGTTLESLCLFRFFWARAAAISASPGRQFVAITDPGTPLEHLAAERGFRRVFLGPPEVGGRFAALSAFGAVPAALIGVDLHRLKRRAAEMASAASDAVAESENLALVLGAALGELAAADLDKLTFFTSPRLAAFPAWLEQLVAESTGKNGKGIVPITGEPIAGVDLYARDRVFVSLAIDGDGDQDLADAMETLRAAGFPTVRIRLSDPFDLGGEILRWEIAVAAAGAALGIQPFDQPDVQLAKDLARKAMGPQPPGEAALPAPGKTVAVADGERLRGSLHQLLRTARPGDYFSLQAYLAPTAETTAALQSIRVIVRDGMKLATTAGYGPRFLHSTGQLHKGGPDTGVFLQLVDQPEEDTAVPETDFTFGAVIRAQALGDYAVLEQRGRRILRVDLGRDTRAGLGRLLEAWNSR